MVLGQPQTERQDDRGNDATHDPGNPVNIQGNPPVSHRMDPIAITIAALSRAPFGYRRKPQRCHSSNHSPSGSMIAVTIKRSYHRCGSIAHHTHRPTSTTAAWSRYPPSFHGRYSLMAAS